MINDLGLQNQQLVDDYKQWDAYYNHMLTKFYVEKLAKQCVHYGKEFPRNVDWSSLHTNKFVMTKDKTVATMGVNFRATHFVEDTYYNVTLIPFNLFNFIITCFKRSFVFSFYCTNKILHSKRLYL